CIYTFFFSSRRRHTRSKRDWSSDVCSSDLDRHLITLRRIGGISRVKQGTKRLNVAALDGSHHGRHIGITYFTHPNPPDVLFENFLIPFSPSLLRRLEDLAAVVLRGRAPYGPEYLPPQVVPRPLVLRPFFGQVVPQMSLDLQQGVQALLIGNESTEFL